jgi:uncharacterized membrane protein
MDRRELDAFVALHGLEASVVAIALDAADARPSPAESARFLTRCLRLAGVLSLASGLIFFIAANWHGLGVFGRFGLIEGAVILSAAVAIWKTPPRAAGRYALLTAFIATGAELALFGQTYQTGADLYELFLAWTLIGLPFVFAARWSVSWAAWALIGNVALWLYCGWPPPISSMWTAPSRSGFSLAQYLLVPTIVDLTLWLLIQPLEFTRWRVATPRWLGRFVFACGMLSGLCAGVLAILEPENAGHDGGNHTTVLLFLAIQVAIAVRCLRARDDVFPLALIAASMIILSTCAIARYAHFGEGAVVLFVLSLWLVVSSTLSGRALMRLVRAWQKEGSTP